MFSIKYLVLLITFYGMLTEGKYFRSDYTYHPAIDTWLKLHVVPGTWHDARQRCYLEGATLASPVNADMQHALNSEMNKSLTECAGIYTGVNSIFSKGYFFSIEGVPLAKMPVQWMPGEPDNAGNNEDCIAYVDGRVADVNCSEVLPFVCYKKSSGYMSLMACGTTDTNYEFKEKTGSCYKLHKNPRNWTEAYEVCSAEGGYLAIINSREEAAVLQVMYRQHYPAAPQHDITYIGFLDWSKDRVWRTVHGQTLEEAGYEDWEKPQPDNASPGQYCGAMFPNAKLDDFWCDRKAKFMCEKDPDSLQD